MSESNDSRIKNANLSEQMKTSFLSYAMSVIVARALPDVRDGMKPVHRRILYSMIEQGNTPDKPHKNQRVSSVMSWVSTIRTVIQLFMNQWFVWHNHSHIDTC